MAWVSQTRCVTGPRIASLPLWRQGMAVGEWKQIAGTDLTSVDPSPVPNPGSTAGKVRAYMGAVLDVRSGSDLYFVAAGGHTDYSGNEVDRLRLDDDAPAWVQLLAPTASASVLDADYYADGRPASRHTYYTQHIDETNNRVMMFGGSRWNSGAALNVVDSFNIGSNNYSASGTHPDMPSSATTGLNNQEVKPFCRDPRNGNVYAFANFNVGKWDRAANTWSMPISLQTAPYAGYTASAFDSTRNRIFLIGNGYCWHYAPDTNTATTVTPTGISLTATSNMGMVYDETADKFFIRDATSGGTVYQCDPVTFDITALTTTGGSTIPLTPGTGPGPYNRFLYAPRLAGVVFVPVHDAGVWFLRTH